MFSANRFRWIIVFIAGVLAVCAACILILIPSMYSVAILDVSFLPLGPIPSGPSIYTYYPNATLAVEETEPGSSPAERVLKARIENSEQWTGFGVACAARAEPDAVLRLRWRCRGSSTHIQVDLRERDQEGAPSAEVFSTVVPFLPADWVTTELPLKGFARNQFYQPSANGDKTLDPANIGFLAITFPPGSDLTLEIADARFDWHSSRWQTLAITLLAGFLVVVVLEALQLLVRGQKAERTLKTSEANYMAIFNAVKEGIWLLDESGTVLDVNRMASDMVGIPRESMLGRGFREVLLLSGTQECEQALERIFSKRYQEMECRLQPKGREILWVEIRATHTTIDNRERLLVVARDVGDKKDAERERLQLEQRLMHSQKMEALGKLAGGVAHDFNNILTGITLAAGMATLDSGPNSAVAGEIRQIQELADRAASLTRQMLTFSRRQELHPVPLHLNALIDDALTLLGRLIGEDVRLSFTPGTENDLIRADRTQIEQILMNLSLNSRDAMPKGGDLRIRTSSHQLNGQCPDLCLPAGQYVLLEIEDTGAGMDNQTRRRIFEPFFTTKEPGRGTGLGLATVYGIVVNHGGAITVDTALGIGTNFRIYFPYVEVIEAMRSAPVDLSAPRGSGLILVVEDDPSVRLLVEETLASFGYRTLSAGCSDEAEQLYRQWRGEIALLLTDVVMPGESGPRFYQRLTLADPNLKVLFMSGYVEGAASEVLGRGLPFIQKPFQPAELARVVSELLRQMPPVHYQPV